MRVYKINPGIGLNNCTEKDPRNIIDWLQEMDEGSSIEVTVEEMTEEEYNRLPEYVGP